MSFVTFPSRTRSRHVNIPGNYMRHDKNTTMEDAKLFEMAIIDVLNYFGSTFRPFHVSRKQTSSAPMSGAIARRILRYMRKVGVPATLISVAKQGSRLRVAFSPLPEGNRVEFDNKEGSAYADCPLPATPDDFADSVLPQGLQALFEKGSELKDVFDSSVLDISSRSVSPPAKPQSSSMSRRRSSCNMPTLQRILPLSCVPPYTIHDFEGFRISFPAHACSTPITPLDQIIHTPRNPPMLHPDARRGAWSPVVEADSGFESPLQVTSPFVSPSVRVAGRARRAILPASDRRRLSVVAPPEAPPMHARRRLSYSKAFGKHNSSSPLSSRKNSVALGEGLACCPENELLASPLAIRPSSSAPQRAVLDTCGVQGIFSKDFSFTFAVSPRVAKV